VIQPALVVAEIDEEWARMVTSGVRHACDTWYTMWNQAQHD